MVSEMVCSVGQVENAEMWKPKLKYRTKARRKTTYPCHQLSCNQRVTVSKQYESWVLRP